MNTPQHKTHRRWLSGVGQHAELIPDTWIPGAWVLSIGGAEQSHVNPAAPHEIFYEYLRRTANHLDLLGSPGTALKVLHLGAGALTLVRYLSTTRPGSSQFAVDSERELMGFVTESLPLPADTNCELMIGDAREVVADKLAGEAFDAVILDVFAGADAPEHLRADEFHREIRDLLAPEGISLVNVGDDPPFAFIRQQINAMEETYRQVTVAAPQELFSRRAPGNFILMGTDTAWDGSRLDALRSMGPHPGSVLSGVDLDGLRKP
ncbi:spermidine synthase [Arthrobacter sp. AOP36-C1-22]|uniref:spermidine synthase n=1 Tax=Arthrobacter sp. AOP36-C1-22 TaxID=3457683 RepID=UPI00403428C0